MRSQILGLFLLLAGASSAWAEPSLYMAARPDRNFTPDDFLFGASSEGDTIIYANAPEEPSHIAFARKLPLGRVTYFGSFFEEFTFSFGGVVVIAGKPYIFYSDIRKRQPETTARVPYSVR